MALRGTNIDEASRYNQRVVLEMVRRNGPLSRADIARATGLVSQTISNIADALIEADLLIEERRPGSRRGQPPIDLRINPRGRYSIGFSIDRRWLVAVLTDFAGTPIGEREIAIPGLAPGEVLPMLAEATTALLRGAKAPRERLLGAGLAMPGLTESGTFINLAREYPWRDRWRERPFVAEIEALLNVPVFTDADRTAAAYGERLNGVGQNYANYVYIFFGSGLGAGFIFSGLPYRGFHGKAGEIGHIVVDPGGRPCPCGNRGCLERYVSLQAAQAAMADTPYAAEPIDTSLLSKALADGHPTMLAWLEEAAFYLSAGIVSLENIFDSEVVLVGGFIPEDLLDALIERMGPLPPSVSATHGNDKPRLLKAATGRRIVAVGAASLPVLESTVPDLRTLQRHNTTAVG